MNEISDWITDHLSLVLIIIITLSGIIINRTRNLSTKTLTRPKDPSLLWFRLGYPAAIICAWLLEQSGWGAYSSQSGVPAGLALFIGGLILRWAAVVQLRQQFTVQLGIRENHQLITKGLYTSIRHPSYTGLILYYTGLGLVMQNLYSFLILVVITTVIVVLRIKREEKMLAEHFGDEWETYRRRTWRLIPWIY